MADLSRRLSCSVDRLQQIEAGFSIPSAEEAEQLTVLSLHLSNYTQQLEYGPQAEVALRVRGFEQIHTKDLKTRA